MTLKNNQTTSTNKDSLLQSSILKKAVVVIISSLVFLLFVYQKTHSIPENYLLYTESSSPHTKYDDPILGPISGSRPPSSLNGNTLSNLKFSVKNVFHQNVDKPIGIAAMGRLDITGDTFEKLQKDTPSVIYGSEEVSPWDHLYSINLQPNYLVTRLEDRSPDYVESYIHYANSYRYRNLPEIKSEDLMWIDEQITVPNVTDRDTVISLAIMAANAYVDIPFTGDWLNVTGDWSNNNTYDFGWNADGIRGHVFLSQETPDAPEGSIVVVSIKGTSAAIFNDGGDTAPKDKENDNLLFSCCCARVSYMWNTVCDCYTGESYTCNQDCLERELYKKDRYYKAAMEIYRKVQELYPDSSIWVTGHSLGGSLAALLGRTYGLPVVAFEAPGELLPARRLHLPMPPGIPVWREHIWHFGHNADPIFVGQCNGATSSCSMGGYAMESVCHTGLECVYDTVNDLGWYVSLTHHRIHAVITGVLLNYNNTAECKIPPSCQDCKNWKYVTDNDDDDEKPVPSKTTSLSVTDPISTKTTTIPPPTGPVTTITPPSEGDNNQTDPEVPKKCLRRNWYGRCIEWEFM